MKRLMHGLNGQGTNIGIPMHCRFATSDGLIQNAVFSQGALRISAREFKNRIDFINTQIKEKTENL